MKLSRTFLRMFIKNGIYFKDTDASIFIRGLSMSDYYNVIVKSDESYRVPSKVVEEIWSIKHF